MDGQHYKFRKGQRVRLKATVDPAIYGDFGVVGNEGVIQARRKDRFDLPEVYVQWDTNHWAYNGVIDCWTFEDHFELVENKMASKKDQANELVGMFAEGMARIFGEEDPPEEQEPNSLTSRFLGAAQGFQKQRNDEYGKAIEAATEKLQESEAFIIIGVERQGHPASPKGVLEPFALGYSRTTEGDILVTAHMASVAARAHQELALQTIAQMHSED